MFVTKEHSVKTDMCGRRLNSSDRREPKVEKEKQSAFSMLRSAQATTLDCRKLQSVEAKIASLEIILPLFLFQCDFSAFQTDSIENIIRIFISVECKQTCFDLFLTVKFLKHVFKHESLLQIAIY